MPIKHQQTLKWFVENEGCEYKPQKLFAFGAVLVVHPLHKFIHPGWSQNVLAIRAGEGDSSKWKFEDDGTWTITVPLNSETISAKDDDDLMKALVLSWKDRVPIGIFKEVDNNLVVEGLGFGLEIEPESVVLGSANRNENPIARWRSTQEELRQIALSVQGSDAEMIKSTWSPPYTLDDRKRVSTEVVQRVGQTEFRRDLLEAYRSTCAVTGSRVAPILEAAHIIPYAGKRTNDVQIGILLRSDIHALFDLGLIAVDEDAFTVLVHDSLQESEYGHLHGRPIAIPRRGEQRPSKEALKVRRKLFADICDTAL